jgi:microcystin-dependent protein
MTIQVKHAFVSLKGDGTDNTQIQPSNWNASHSVTLASGQLMGRLSGGVGAVEEIPISSYMASLLTVADVATLSSMIGLFTTGDVKYTFSSSAPAGWILIAGAGSIGDASSGASIRANADTWPLFQLIYNSISDSLAPVNGGGRSGNAAADFNAHKVIQLPPLTGRSPISTGAIAGLTPRALGAPYGEENHALIAAEIPGILSTTSVSGTLTGATSTANLSTTNTGTGGGGFLCGGPVGGVSLGVTVSGTLNGGSSSTNTGGSAPQHNNMHPVMALNVMVKL